MSDKIAEENHVIWEIEYCAPPAVLRYCKKCGKKEEYLCSNGIKLRKISHHIIVVWDFFIEKY